MDDDSLPEEARGEALSLRWYVGLAQLPGTSIRVREGVEALVRTMLRELPVVGRSTHSWGGVRAGLEAPTAPAEPDMRGLPGVDALA